MNGTTCGPLRPDVDGRLIAPRQRVREVLHGDEERFEVTASLDALSVVTNAGHRLVLACELR